jgi:hypothetical protein
VRIYECSSPRPEDRLELVSERRGQCQRSGTRPAVDAVLLSVRSCAVQRPENIKARLRASVNRQPGRTFAKSGLFVFQDDLSNSNKAFAA